MIALLAVLLLVAVATFAVAETKRRRMIKAGIDDLEALALRLAELDGMVDRQRATINRLQLENNELRAVLADGGIFGGCRVDRSDYDTRDGIFGGRR